MNKDVKISLDLMMSNDELANNEDIQKLIDFSLFERNKEGKTQILFAAAIYDANALNNILTNPFIDVNIPDIFGNTSLNLAARNRHIDFVRLLLKRKDITVNIKNKTEYTPLHNATEKGHLKCIHMLLSHKVIDTSIRTFTNNTLENIALINNHR